ncbi:calcium-transporting ATPase 12, plasma membrane-type-like [Prosopis cineraria]|uniref:calcium-transporting ATPase 12, plasma membrane-type-like n=1 Tax=Prosopis cineraria TaxID=364024 RepID=UPI0024104D4C|nr:calcium-transporting ATPase 12, plasma membrane-type-like [Prosopis cineraria]
MSSQSNDFVEGDVNTELGASLIVTGKYGRLWRRSSLYIRIFISLTRTTTTTTTTHESEQSPHYTPLPTSPSPPTRTSSAKSSIEINIASDNEEDIACVEQRIKNSIARIVKDKDLELLRELGGVNRVRSVLIHRQSEEGNIDNGNHQVLETTDQVHGRRLLYCFTNSCKRNSYTISLLMISALLSLATEIKQEGPKYGWHDSAAIVVAIIMIVAVSSVANYGRERKMLKLSEKKGELKFTVVRCETSQMVAISDIMVGDIVCLKRGDEAPADGLLLNNEHSVQDEMLDPFLLFGSKVFYGGETSMLVTSVRDEKSVEMQNSAANRPKKITLLESRIEKPISIIDKVALLISTLVALVVLIRLLSKKNGDNNGLPEIKGKVSVGFLIELMERIFLKPQGKVSILTSLLTVAIISVQHGVPLMVTLSLKYQIDKVVSNEAADLHDLSSCATMGLVTVICIDASGGLMSKLTEVSRVRVGERDFSRDGASEINAVVCDILQQGASVSVLAPEFTLSPVSNSLSSWAKKTWGVNSESFSQNFTILKHNKHNYKEDGSGVLVSKIGDQEQVLHLHWSGAARTILEMCSHYYDINGECCGITNQKVQFEEVIKEMEDSGLEPIALAYQKTEAQELQRGGLILLALIGLKHSSYLEETKLALADLKNDGVKIKLVSEQDIMAVRALACELGIEVPVEDGVIVEGKEIQNLNSTARLKKLDEALVMGGFFPNDKVLMIQSLQDGGHVVAFFGALTVSDAAVREAADIVIDDKSQNPEADRECSNISIERFNAITITRKSGRCQYLNTQKFIQLQLTASLSGSFITLIAAMCTGQSPLTPFQLIWVNMIMCLLGGLMMLMELNIKEDQHANQLNNRKQSLISHEIWMDIASHVLYQAFVSMIFLFGGQVTDSTKQVRTTMIFNIFMLCQVFNQLNILGLMKKGVFKIVLKSYCFLVTLGVSLVMQVLVIQYARSLADYLRLNATQWAICIVVSALSWVIQWPLKMILNWMFHHAHSFLCTIQM